MYFPQIPLQVVTSDWIVLVTICQTDKSIQQNSIPQSYLGLIFPQREKQNRNDRIELNQLKRQNFRRVTVHCQYFWYLMVFAFFATAGVLAVHYGHHMNQRCGIFWQFLCQTNPFHDIQRKTSKPQSNRSTKHLCDNTADPTFGLGESSKAPEKRSKVSPVSQRFLKRGPWLQIGKTPLGYHYSID